MTIRIWPDGTWQSTEDTPYSWLSDDYEVHFVPDDIDPDDYVKDKQWARQNATAISSSLSKKRLTSKPKS